MTAARRTRASAIASSSHENTSNTLTPYSHEAVKNTLPRQAAAASRSAEVQGRPVTTMASARKGKAAAARQSSSSSSSGQPGGVGSTSMTSTTSTTLPISPAVTTSTVTTSKSTSTRPAARSSSRRHAHQQEGEDGQVVMPQLHEIPPNVLQAQGLAAISTSLIDNLPEPSFPKKGITLHPNDQNDPLLILCGKVLASVSNRALTPKEIALILARRHGWQFSGSQPFAVVSSCIRSHVRRATLAIPPYNPIFTSYELSSIPPAEDIPCLGIEADSKPVVKRGTFWFLSENMGYGYPFPHRRGSASLATTAPPSASTTPSTSSAPSNSTSISQAPSQAPQPQNRRSSSRHQLSITPTQPVPIMPAPPVLTTTSTSSSLPTLAPRGRSDPKTDRLTRAQKNAQTTPEEDSQQQQQQQQQVTMMAQSAPVPSNMASGWKRKRPNNKTIQQHQVNLAHNSQALSNSYPHSQELPAGTNETNIRPALVKSGGNKKASSASSSSASHRRAFSSSAGDGSLVKPAAIPALRKLKLRLSAVSESAPLDPTSPMDLLSASLPASSTNSTKKVTLLGKSTSSSSSKQRKSKRARTQSMSHHTNTTASFPFDDLHLYHSMQQNNQTLIQYNNSPSSSTSSTANFHHNHNHTEGTLFPFEMHMPSSSVNATDLLLTSRSAPEGENLFSPALAAASVASAAAQHIAGPFSRSHSPSTSIHHYHYRATGRRSLPPQSEYENEDSPSLQASIDLEYDGWGMDSDHLEEAGGGNGQRGRRGGEEEEEDSFHEAMLKNDDIDFEFDFSLGSLGKSASRFSILNPDESNLSLEEVEEADEDDEIENEGGDRGDEDTVTIVDGMQTGGPRRSMSILESLAVDAVLDGLDKEQNGDSLKATVLKKKRPSLGDRRKSSASSGADSIMEEDEAASEDEVEEEEDSQVKHEDTASSTARIALSERRAFERALNTTLCPAAAKLGEGSTTSKSARSLARRMNSSSSLTFARASIPSIRTSDLPADLTPSLSPVNNATSATSTTNPLLRPSPVSRRNSRDVLSSAVPLAELPSIPLEDNRRDSFLFYHLTSDADPPSYFNDGFKSSPPRIDGEENIGTANGERDDDMSDAASSSSASTTSSLLTRIVKSEEELDDMVDMEEDGNEAEEHDDDTTTRRDTSRCCSTTSAISHAELESNDSFNPEMIYPVGSSRRAPSADLASIGGQGELLDDQSSQNQLNSRSQSSSRTTSLSPRDSFSPRLIHHHHHLHHDGGGGSYSSEVEADWALTPPSEEEHVDEDEKNLDRATMLGLESVGMEDLDDVWPGVRRSLGGVGANGRNGNTIEAQVDGVTSGFKIMEVFEPVLSAAPIPPCDIPSPILFSLSNTSMTTDADDTITTTMEIDSTPMDEHAAAAMFIADESLHPPKPAPILTVTAASEAGDANDPQSSLSPVSAATRDATIIADAQAPTSNAVNILQQNSAADSVDRDSTTPVQQHQQIQSTSRQPMAQPTSTQSFLFYPEKPFHPEISILLTDTKILFYSTIVNIPKDGRPLLRRVDNDAVDAEALLLSLEGMGGLDSDRIETLRKIKELGNTWVSLDFARELLNKYGGLDPLLGIFLADDILLAWNEKLVKLGSMLRQKNGLPTPAIGKNGERAATAVKLESTSASSPTDVTSKSKRSPSPTSAQDTKESSTEVDPIRIETKKETAVTSTPSSSPKKEKTTKSKLARRASARIKPTAT